MMPPERPPNRTRYDNAVSSAVSVLVGGVIFLAMALVYAGMKTVVVLATVLILLQLLNVVTAVEHVAEETEGRR